VECSRTAEEEREEMSAEDDLLPSTVSSTFGSLSPTKGRLADLDREDVDGPTR